MFISCLLVVDTFFVSYAVGFNSRSVLVVDASLPPYVKPSPTVETTKAAEPKSRLPGHDGQTHNHSKKPAANKPKHVSGI
jgi:hypothetical protein